MSEVNKQDVEQKVFEIISKYSEVQLLPDTIGDLELKNLGLNSLNMISAMVDIETEYDFEFPDETYLLLVHATYNDFLNCCLDIIG